MKKKYQFSTPIIAFVVVFMLAVGLSFAEVREFALGAKDSNNVYRLTGTRDTSGAYISLPPTGVGWNPAYELFTTDAATNNLDPTDSGRRLIDTTTFGSRYILPQAIAGIEIELCAGNQVTVTLDTHDTGDTINHSISGTLLNAGDALLSSGEAGDCIRVTSGSTDNWYVTGMGPNAWTDHGSN